MEEKVLFERQIIDLVDVEPVSALHGVHHSQTREDRAVQNNGSEARQTSSELHRGPASDRLAVEDYVFLLRTVRFFETLIRRLDIRVRIVLTRL